MICGQNHTVVSTSTSEGESIGGTVSAVSAVLAAESLRARPKNAEERQICGQNRTVVNENVEILGSRPLAWNKMLQIPNIKVGPKISSQFTWEKDNEGATCLRVPDGCVDRALSKVNLSLI
ncbi:hypothetical protein KI387_044704, partial [Taxus chinensis]